jgi:hypothetical protein
MGLSVGVQSGSPEGSASESSNLSRRVRLVILGIPLAVEGRCSVITSDIRQPLR